MTLIRLWIRRGRYWWDDAWAFFSLLWYIPTTFFYTTQVYDLVMFFFAPFRMIIQMVLVFVHGFPPSELSKVSRIAGYYLLSATFYGIIWSARLSILFSIIRIDPNPVMRQRMKWVAVVFIAAVAFLLAQLFWVCQTNENGWKDSAHPQCVLPKQVPICQLVCTYLLFYTPLRLPHQILSHTADVFSDIALIIFPMRLIRGIDNKRLRWRLIFIFSTSSTTFPFSPLFFSSTNVML
jgi:hypothetical protein